MCLPWKRDVKLRRIECGGGGRGVCVCEGISFLGGRKFHFAGGFSRHRHHHQKQPPPPTPPSTCLLFRFLPPWGMLPRHATCVCVFLSILRLLCFKTDSNSPPPPTQAKKLQRSPTLKPTQRHVPLYIYIYMPSWTSFVSKRNLCF